MTLKPLDCTSAAGLMLMALSLAAPGQDDEEATVPSAVCVSEPCDGAIVDDSTCIWYQEELNCRGPDGSGGSCEWCEGDITRTFCKNGGEADCLLVTGVPGQQGTCGEKYTANCYFDNEADECICHKPDPLGTALEGCALRLCMNPE